MSDAPQILMARKPVRFEARNYKGKHKRLKHGNIWLAEIEIDRETWDLLDTMPDGAILEAVLWWSDGDPVENLQPEIASGPYALFWGQMFKRRFWLNRELAEALQVDALDSTSVGQLLHHEFETTSLSLVAPDRWENWCEERHLHSLITMGRTAAAESK